MSPIASTFLRGLVVGFAIAAPVGAVGVQCIRTTLDGGRRAGVASGLGAATADSLYGAVAAFGLTAVSHALISASAWIRVLGGLFLIYLGVRTFLSLPKCRDAGGERRGLFTGYATTFAMTITNPMTILSFVAVFAGMGLGASPGSGWSGAAALVAGVFCGSAAWWLVLAALVGSVRTMLDQGRLVWVNRVSGSVIACFGLVALAGLAR